MLKITISYHLRLSIMYFPNFYLFFIGQFEKLSLVFLIAQMNSSTVENTNTYANP